MLGERWCLEKRSAILLVPSVIVRLDSNILVNPGHPAFRIIEVSLHQPIFWDRRLFGV